MMNSLLIKFYNNYAIIHVQHFLKPSYIKYYNILSIHRTSNLLVFYKFITRSTKKYETQHH